MDSPLNFIIVDDDYGNNLYCKIIIKKTIPGTDIQTFLQPEKGLEYIKNVYPHPNGNKTILFLDINMPTMSGWEFLEVFDELDESVKKQIKIYTLTSSVNYTDKQKSDLNKNVSGYITKPLTDEILLKISADKE